MPITLITGPANAGKDRAVADAVRGHLARGDAPLLVVRTRADAEHQRRELAGDRAALGVRVERFDGLIGEAVRRAGASEPALGSLARERVLAAIAARSETPAVAGGLAGGPTPEARSPDEREPAPATATPGFVRALAAFVAELQLRRVTPARLNRALDEWAAADGPRAAVVQAGRLFEEYQRVLAAIGRVDQEQRAARALDALRRTPTLWGRTPVLFCGFDELTRLQLDAIETIGAIVGASVTVSLAYEPGRMALAAHAGSFQALAPLASEHLQPNVRAGAHGPRGHAAHDAAEDGAEDAAARRAAAARAALSHLERSLFEPGAGRVDPAGGVRLLEGGGERAELELVAAEIGALLRGGMAPADIAVLLRAPGAQAELLEDVLSSAGIPHALTRRRPFADTGIGRAMIGLLRCVPAPGRPSAQGGDAGDLLAWLRAPGVLDHPELADRLEARARRTGASTAAQARALWEDRHWPLEAIDHLGEAVDRGAAALLDRAESELQRLFRAPRRGKACVLGSDELDDARALGAARRALAELRDLARAAPELAPSSAIELASVLERVELTSGERSTEGRVAVLDVAALPGADGAGRPRALFVCGLQEGAFPAPARPRPFLAEEQRRRLAETSGLRLGEHEDALQSERYLFYAAVSRPRELLVLSWHTACDDGSPATRSLFVDDVCDLFAPSLAEQCVRRSLGAIAAPAANAPTRARLPRKAPAALHDEELLWELRRHTWSASSLEVWMSCPVRWMVERMLRADALDPDPEPLARGGLAHAALRDTLEGLRERTGSARLTPGTLRLARELLVRALEENEADFPLSVMPERRPGVRRRLRADLERYLGHAAESESPLEPRHLELRFGFADEPDGGLPALEIGGGVMLRGRIDRVDVGEGGEAIVYDYKGRSVPPAAKWVARGSLQVALYMRAVEDLLGLRAVGGFYQPLSGPDMRARGVLDADAGLQIECVGDDSREHAGVRALLDEAAAAAIGAAAQAERGELQPRPETCSFRGGCMYPTICRCERG